MNYNKYEHYNVKVGRRAEQVENYRKPSSSVKELPEITDTVNEYKEKYDFENLVLQTYFLFLPLSGKETNNML